ncbi:hypothetical protein [Pseudomonas aeruginosa]|uniref:hypothetical protein n=1 Tax=Pseudomonas aeruginosa group TaxID=136841 RepID=UPI0004BC9F12|nr:hypothetical protein [Pseudomonas aeruginosa]EJN6721468.1 hypothetical protein [Pseudomonas aeruginosa]ELP1385640.1 hypothetical protein [Pseudomonas aeruginosa]MBW6173774.1 hypothetical protein [Pseudomonas aeruginosa]MBW6214691.1 hypothetical protein [Pseudomonas aeruginosa]MDG4221582.1 hypothetical protein [Pseudomonas aeruginosa]
MFYIGGFEQYSADLNASQNQVAKGDAPGAPSAQSEWPEINSAWCNPRMDDDCYINEKKVPVAELGKWLPAVSQSNIDQIGGYCETILCFDKDDQPAGYLLQ